VATAIPLRMPWFNLLSLVLYVIGSRFGGKALGEYFRDFFPPNSNIHVAIVLAGDYIFSRSI
jgi:hypothetical protein